MTLTQILSHVSATTATPIASLVSPTRAWRVYFPRLVYYRLARTYTGSTHDAIAKHCGGRHHSAVTHALKTFSTMMEVDPEFRTLYQTTESLLPKHSTTPRTNWRGTARELQIYNQD